MQPRFIKYFKIPKYTPKNEIHRRLAEIGKAVHSEGEELLKKMLKEIERLVEML